MERRHKILIALGVLMTALAAYLVFVVYPKKRKAKETAPVAEADIQIGRISGVVQGASTFTAAIVLFLIVMLGLVFLLVFVGVVKAGRAAERVGKKIEESDFDTNLDRAAKVKQIVRR